MQSTYLPKNGTLFGPTNPATGQPELYIDPQTGLAQNTLTSGIVDYDGMEFGSNYGEAAANQFWNGSTYAPVAPVSVPQSTVAYDTNVYDVPYVPPDPTTDISSTSPNDSGYGDGFTAPTATVPVQSGISTTMLIAIPLLCFTVYLWFKHFRS